MEIINDSAHPVASNQNYLKCFHQSYRGLNTFKMVYHTTQTVFYRSQKASSNPQKHPNGYFLIVKNYLTQIFGVKTGVFKLKLRFYVDSFRRNRSWPGGL